MKLLAAAVAASAALAGTGTSAAAATDIVLSSAWGSTTRPAAVKGDLFTYWLAVKGGSSRALTVTSHPVILNRYTVYQPVLVEVVRGRTVYRYHGNIRKLLPKTSSGTLTVVRVTWANGEKVQRTLKTWL